MGGCGGSRVGGVCCGEVFVSVCECVCVCVCCGVVVLCLGNTGRQRNAVQVIETRRWGCGAGCGTKVVVKMEHTCMSVCPPV